MAKLSQRTREVLEVAETASKKKSLHKGNFRLLSDLAKRADKGDEGAIQEYNEVMSKKKYLKRVLDKEDISHVLADGGKIDDYSAYNGAVVAYRDAEGHVVAEEDGMYVYVDSGSLKFAHKEFLEKVESGEIRVIDIPLPFKKGGEVKEGWISLTYKDKDGIDWAKDRLIEDKVNEVLKQAGIKCKSGQCDTGTGITIPEGERDITFHVPIEDHKKAMGAIKDELKKNLIKTKDLKVEGGASPVLAEGGEVVNQPHVVWHISEMPS